MMRHKYTNSHLTPTHPDFFGIFYTPQIESQLLDQPDSHGFNVFVTWKKTKRVPTVLLPHTKAEKLPYGTFDESPLHPKPDSLPGKGNGVWCADRAGRVPEKKCGGPQIVNQPDYLFPGEKIQPYG